MNSRPKQTAVPSASAISRIKAGQVRSHSIMSSSTGKVANNAPSPSTGPSATAAAAKVLNGDVRSSPRKSSIVPSTANRVRRASNPPGILPVLCVYSDQNQLVRKEQFRTPEVMAVATKIPVYRKNKDEDAVVVRPAVQPPQQPPVSRQSTNRTATLFQSTVASAARLNSSNNNNGAKRTKLAVPRSANSNSINNNSGSGSKFQASAKAATGARAEKVSRRNRNENGIPLLSSRRAEMTSAGNNHSRAAPAAHPTQSPATANAVAAATITTTGKQSGRPATHAGSSSTNGDTSLVRPSVSVLHASRVEVPNSNGVSLHNNSRSHHHHPPSLTPKRASPRSHSSNKSQPSSTSPPNVISPPSHLSSRGPFHSSSSSSNNNSRAVVTDNPDLKKKSQGSTVAAADADSNSKSHGAEMVFDGAPSGLAVDVVDSCAPARGDLDNYVVFEYPIEIAHRRHREVMGTQPELGYGSDKSPGSDTPPSCEAFDPYSRSYKEDDLLDDLFKFVSKDNIIKVTVHKTVQGLGLSVTGGVMAPSNPAPSGPCFSPAQNGESCGMVACSWPGLIRIKKIFPHGAAWQTGKLEVGDVLLSASGQPLTGCTNYEALELLRCTPRETELEVCRIPKEIAEKMGMYPIETAATSSSSSSSNMLSSHSTNWLAPILTLSVLGEFEISMTKVNGSLGFTLRKEDESILGHYIRSLVKEPALSDGRILPGDKIISVNGVDMSAMSHGEAVAFLRRCPETVTIRLFRDSAITPISPLSPTEPESTLNRPRPLLRQEAQDLLHDLAVRKQGGSRGGSPAPALSGSPCSPRRRRLTKTPSPDLASVVKDRFGSIPPPVIKDSSSCIPANSNSSPPMSPLPEMDMERDAVANGLELTDSILTASFHTPSNSCNSARVTRPDFLDLSNSLVKKQRFMFTPPNGQPPSSFEERESGDGQPEPSVGHQGELDITQYHTPTRLADSTLEEGSGKSFSGSFCVIETSPSLPTNQSTLDCPLEDTMDEDFVSFHSSSTLERYAPQGVSDRDLSSRFPLSDMDGGNGAKSAKGGLAKWKGVVLTPDEDYAEEAHLGLIQTIELNKGWNSRLGFSVGLSDDGQLVISAIYDDSVAAKDGRLEVGDHVLRVNGEKLAGCSKDYVIDILRKTRGPVAITVRKTG